MNIAVITDDVFEYDHEGCSIKFFPSSEAVFPKDWQSFDAAFLLTPYDRQAQHYWTGHPHLRCVDTAAEMTAELDIIFSNIECEKKLLIALPDLSELKKYYPFKAEIEQTYLLTDKGSHRIRKRIMGEVVSYVETVKMRITPTVSHEFEKRITEEQYKTLLKKADPAKHPIRKKRYCFLYKKQYFELDVYDFWQDKATLELELRSEEQRYSLPPEIKVIRDVSDDPRYKNNYLASIAYENYSTELL